MAFQKSDLVRASSDNEPKIVEEVLKKYPSQVDFQLDGCTALQIASRKGHLEIMKILVNWGADLDFPDVNYNTPLHFAVTGDQPDAVELLLNLGASMDDKNFDGITPRQLADTKNSGCSEKFPQRDSIIALNTPAGAELSEFVEIEEETNEATEEAEGGKDEEEKADFFDCVFCNEYPAIVNFEPCGHLVACFLCCFKNDACPTCGHVVDRISFTETKEVLRYMGEVKNFHDKVQNLEDMSTCIICKNRKINCTLGCGHMYCHKCVRRYPEHPRRHPDEQAWICQQCKTPSRYIPLDHPWEIPSQRREKWG